MKVQKNTKKISKELLQKFGIKEEWFGIDDTLPRAKDGVGIMGARMKDSEVYSESSKTAPRYHYSIVVDGKELCIITDKPLRPSDANSFDQPTTKAGSRAKRGSQRKSKIFRS